MINYKNAPPIKGIRIIIDNLILPYIYTYKKRNLLNRLFRKPLQTKYKIIKKYNIIKINNQFYCHSNIAKIIIKNMEKNNERK